MNESKIALSKSALSTHQVINQDMGSQPIIQSSDMGDVMKNMFPSAEESKVRMLGNLHPIEEVSIRGINIMSEIGVLPKKCAASANILFQSSVSRFARGRDDGVNIAYGYARQQQEGRSLMDRLGNFFGGGNKQ